MKNGRGFLLVLVTAPDLKVGRDLAEVLCKERVAACVNLVPGLESHYWWENKLEKSREVLLIVKTRSAHLDRVEKLVAKHHPYDTPEIIALPLTHGSKRYLTWWAAEAKGTG